MKAILVVIFSALVYGLSFGQVTKIGQHVTMKFPSVPDIEQSENRTMYVIVDSAYFLSATVTDLQDKPNYSFTPDELQDFYRGVIKGTLKGATDSKLLNETTIKCGEYEGREIKYTKDFNGLDDIPGTTRILVVKKSLYVFAIWDLSKRGLKRIEREVFESIAIR